MSTQNGTVNDGLVKNLLDRTRELGEKLAFRRGRKTTVMEVCGTHTVAFARSGLAQLLSGFLDLRSGPGCPVCVTHQEDLDYMIALSRLDNTIIATFGDLVRVPGSSSSLEQEKGRGARVHLCYSPLDAVIQAEKHPGMEVIFLGVGFETTAPAIAVTLREAESRGLKNFTLYPALKLVPPALQALLSEADCRLDGFILPGHVSTILGVEAFQFLAHEHRLPAVVAGFESLDLLAGMYRLLKIMEAGEHRVENAYSHVVRDKGNTVARDIVSSCFEPVEKSAWRGLGAIPRSGYTLHRNLRLFDARERFPLDLPPSRDYPGCRCGEILSGKAAPPHCPLFSNACTPSSPVGPCMVSSEGACGSYYLYRLQHP